MSFLGAAFTAQLFLISLLGQPLATAADDHMGQVTIHARLLDWECWNRMRRGEATLDGSDIMLSPQGHKAGCLQFGICKASGFYLAVKCNTGNYAPLYTLKEDSATIAAVATYVDTLTPYGKTDISVTVTGTNHNGEIQDAVITACTGTTSQCDHGACTGACTSSYTDMYDGFEGCVADPIMTATDTNGTSTSTEYVADDGPSDDGPSASISIRLAIPGVMFMAVSVMAALVTSL